ncbi:MAG: hypothetical protein ACLPT4_04365 [Verrucomicrobiia bacterium]
MNLARFLVAAGGPPCSPPLELSDIPEAALGYRGSLDKAHVDGVDELIAREDVGDDDHLVTFGEKSLLQQGLFSP